MNGITAPPFEFTVPPELEAHEPPEARGLTRDGVRMLVSYRQSDEIHHARFPDFPDFLRAGDVVVVNVSATLPAALTATRTDGTDVALHLSTRLPAGLHVVEFRRSRIETVRASTGSARTEQLVPSVSAGETMTLPDGGTVTALVPYSEGSRLWVARLQVPAPLFDYLGRWGRPIAYPYVTGTWPIESYQTVYAAVPGSAEMPSAGRAFTRAILDRLFLRGVIVAPLVLHAGVASLEFNEPSYEEHFEVPIETAEDIRAAKARGGRVIAIGTTVVRALESSVDGRGRSIASRGWTDLIIAGHHPLRVIDGLLTGFHEPKATHLALLEAVAGRDRVARVYQAALEAGYLWHEFGDLNLWLPATPSGARGGAAEPSRSASR
ncbi:MAG: S-adenosylmethionine:tRNA ribosyltransferase-isomerase [bacterium]